MVPLAEIRDPRNDYNLNLPRYIDTSEPEDIQDIHAHLHGNIPVMDLEAMRAYWHVWQGLQDQLFTADGSANYRRLRVDPAQAPAGWR